MCNKTCFLSAALWSKRTLQGFSAIKKRRKYFPENPLQPKVVYCVAGRKNPSLDFPRVGITGEKNFHRIDSTRVESRSNSSQRVHRLSVIEFRSSCEVEKIELAKRRWYRPWFFEPSEKCPLSRRLLLPISADAPLCARPLSDPRGATQTSAKRQTNGKCVMRRQKIAGSHVAITRCRAQTNARRVIFRNNCARAFCSEPDAAAVVAHGDFSMQRVLSSVCQRPCNCLFTRARVDFSCRERERACLCLWIICQKERKTFWIALCKREFLELGVLEKNWKGTQQQRFCLLWWHHKLTNNFCFRDFSLNLAVCLTESFFFCIAFFQEDKYE